MNLSIISFPGVVLVRALLISSFAACAVLAPYGQNTQVWAAAETEELEALEAQERRVKQAFETEKEDREWSQRAVTLWTQLFQKEGPEEKLEGIRLRNIECRTTLCRVEITSTDPAQDAAVFEQNVDRVMYFLPWQGSGFGKIETPDGQAPLAVIYMAREGHTVPFFPNQLGRGR
jgi:hypothetical protein